MWRLLLLPVFSFSRSFFPTYPALTPPPALPPGPGPILASQRRGRGPGSPASFSEEKGTENHAALLYSFSVSSLPPSFPSFSSFQHLLLLLSLDGRSGRGGSRGGWRRPGEQRPGGRRPWRTAAPAVGGGSGRQSWRMRLPREMCNSRRRAMAAADGDGHCGCEAGDNRCGVRRRP